MGSHGASLVLVGAALLIAYVAHVVGARTHVPRVTLLLLVGVALGTTGLNLVPEHVVSWFPLIAELALAMVGFLLGEEFVTKKSEHSGPVLALALAVTLATAVCVFVLTYLAGASFPLALLLGGIATSTAPAATIDLIAETRAAGRLTDVVRGLVAADDVLGVMIFTLVLAVVEAMSGIGDPGAEMLHAFWELGGAVLLGLSVGIPMAWLTGRLRPGEPAALEALGFVILVAGLASAFGVSLLLASMVLGGSVAHWAKHHTRAVHQIEGFSSPLLAVFFFMAGLELDGRLLWGVGLLGVAYVVGRVLGRVLGGRLAPCVGHSKTIGRRVGLCLLPQAGVAIGMSLLAAERLPGHSETLVSLVVGATVVFEITGPIATRFMLSRAGEIAGPALRRT